MRTSTVQGLRLGGRPGYAVAVATPLSQIRKAAERFLTAHGGYDAPPDALPALLRICGQHLGAQFRIDVADAHDLALSVWSEMTGRQTHCFIDLQLTTPYLLFIVDPVSNTRRTIPLTDLMRFLGPRAVAGGQERAPSAG